jgi:S1-C subfamily serine protease
MSVSNADATGVLAALSDQLASAVERAGRSIVRLEARRRQPASGVIWSSDGLIVTADHVLEREEDLQVGLPNGESAAATIVGRDPGTDLAVLRVSAQGAQAIEHGAAPRVGNLALIVGRPGESLGTSIGVVSALAGPARTWRGGQLEGFIRTDATFYPGFSGGPLIDASGQMIGLATSGLGQGVGLAIPLETVKRVSGALVSHGRVKRGFLGLSSQPVALPEGLRRKLGLEQESGLLVVGVEAGGPAEQGGLLIGDVVLTLGGQPIRHTDDLRGLLGSDRIGQPTPVRVVRAGESRDLSVTIGERR